MTDFFGPRKVLTQPLLLSCDFHRLGHLTSSPALQTPFYFIVTVHLTHPNPQYLEVDSEHVLCVSCLM